MSSRIQTNIILEFGVVHSAYTNSEELIADRWIYEEINTDDGRNIIANEIKDSGTSTCHYSPY